MFSIEYLVKSLSLKLKEHGLSGRKLAINAGLHPAIVRDILNGKSKDPGISKVTGIADVFQCSIDELVGRDARFIDEKRFMTAATALDKALNGETLPLQAWCRCVIDLYHRMENQEISPETVKNTLKKLRSA